MKHLASDDDSAAMMMQQRSAARAHLGLGPGLDDNSWQEVDLGLRVPGGSGCWMD